MDEQIVALLVEAAAKIRNLRRQNEILAARVEMIDLFACVLHTQPARHSVGEEVDIAWKIDQALSDVKLGGGDD